MKINNSDDAMVLIRRIAQTTSTNEKKQILKDHPEISTIVEWTYDPFKRYYISQFPTGVVGRGKNCFTAETWRILRELASRSLSGNLGRQTVYDHIRNLTPSSAQLIKWIITKDLRWGMSKKLINDVWPGMISEHNILLAEDFEHKRVNYPCFVSTKIDGLRGTYKDGHFYFRSGLCYQSLNRYLYQYKEAFNLYAHSLDGEMWVTGCRSFDELSGMLRSHKQIPPERVRFLIFDIMIPNMSFHHRIDLLKGFQFPPGVTVIPHHIAYNFENILTCYRTAITRGFEGVVVKSMEHLYHGKRSYDWMRLVKEYTVDGILVDVEEGIGKNAGAVGALIVRYKEKDLRIGAGKLSYDERKELLENLEDYIGNWLRFTYKGRTEKGKLRHPRFDRWRDPK